MNRSDFARLLKRKVLILDGGYGNTDNEFKSKRRFF